MPNNEQHPGPLGLVCLPSDAAGHAAAFLIGAGAAARPGHTWEDIAGRFVQWMRENWGPGRWTDEYQGATDDDTTRHRADDETVDRVARALATSQGSTVFENRHALETHEDYRRQARATIRALTQVSQPQPDARDETPEPPDERCDDPYCECHNVPLTDDRWTDDVAAADRAGVSRPQEGQQ